ncbi:hypothetical protein NDU88_005782 [Pleurodeles waltl]|uniref:Uncharacterized protein n=1 Tax=Pleurodeles waltl TaxID=8319 RepID=A0AAV7QG67_PLEWA|nr:hypothetical protein NDU88_005782 [Pleurodeles waltl]
MVVATGLVTVCCSSVGNGRRVLSRYGRGAKGPTLQHTLLLPQVFGVSDASLRAPVTYPDEGRATAARPVNSCGLFVPLRLPYVEPWSSVLSARLELRSVHRSPLGAQARAPAAGRRGLLIRPRPRKSQVGHTRVDGVARLPHLRGQGRPGTRGARVQRAARAHLPGLQHWALQRRLRPGRLLTILLPRQWVGESPTSTGASVYLRSATAARPACTVRARPAHTIPSGRRPSCTRSPEPQAGRTQADGPSPFPRGDRANQRGGRPVPSRQPALTSSSGSAARAHPAPITSKSIQLTPAYTPMDKRAPTCVGASACYWCRSHRRGQDFGRFSVGRERSSVFKRPLRQPS